MWSLGAKFSIYTISNPYCVELFSLIMWNTPLKTLYYNDSTQTYKFLFVIKK